MTTSGRRNLTTYREKTGPLLAPCAGIPPSTFLFSMLPTKIQNRIPRLPSLRSRGSSQASKSKEGPVTSRGPGRPAPNSTDPTSISASGTQTPPPAYAAARSLDSAGDSVTYDGDMSLCLVEDNQLWRGERPPLSGALTSPRVAETKTGVAWRFANQGLNLLGLAVEESASLSASTNSQDATLGRHLYIHALTYLLRGLPTDLSPEEQLTVRASLPSGVAEPLRLEVQDQQLLIGPGAESDTASTPPPSMLHRAVASSIVQIFVFFQFLLPYLKLLLFNIYTYERTHHVTEKLLATSLDTVDALGKRGIEVSGAVARLGDGRVGQALNHITVWWVDSVAGGICDGVGEGLVMLGGRGPPGVKVEGRTLQDLQSVRGGR